MSMLFKRIKDWATSITAFRSGDVIPVDGPNGTAKMSKDDLLKESTYEVMRKLGYTPKGEANVSTLNGLSGQENGWLYTMTNSGTLTYGNLAVVAGDMVAWDDINEVWCKAMDYALKSVQDNLVASLASKFQSEQTYDSGDKVEYEGRYYMFRNSHTGAWNAKDVVQININDSFVSSENVKKENIIAMDWKTVDINTGDIIDSTNRNATDYLDVDEYDTLKLSSDTTSCWLRCFDANRQNLFTPSNYSYFSSSSLVYLKELASIYKPGVLKYVVLISINQPMSNPLHYVIGTKNLSRKMLTINADSDSVVSFYYKTDNTGHYSSGKIMLPPNYSTDGAPVPLIVFYQGSADYYKLDATKISENYIPYYKYLRDEGFAILSVFGWGNYYDSIGPNTMASGTWNAPTNQKCWNAGIQYALDNFNLDRENIFASSKSLGGMMSMPCAWSGKFKFNAVGALASTFSLVQLDFGYVQGVNTRKIMAAELGFSEDTNNVLDLADPSTNADYKAYALENYSKWCGYDPSMSALLEANAETKINWSCAPINWRTATYSRALNLKCPLKMWCAADDAPIIYMVDGLFKALQEFGQPVFLSRLPPNTGKHHSVDTDANAPQQTDVTTRLGVHYDTIPLAYYELAQFFIENSNRRVPLIP